MQRWVQCDQVSTQQFRSKSDDHLGTFKSSADSRLKFRIPASAPCCSNSVHTAAWLNCAAQCNGVSSSLFFQGENNSIFFHSNLFRNWQTFKLMTFSTAHLLIYVRLESTFDQNGKDNVGVASPSSQMKASGTFGIHQIHIGIVFKKKFNHFSVDCKQRIWNWDFLHWKIILIIDWRSTYLWPLSDAWWRQV